MRASAVVSLPALSLALALAGCGGTENTNSSTDTGGNNSADSEVPDIAYCDSVSAWDATSSVLEEEILLIVNQRRSEGADCGVNGSYPPVGPLVMNPALRCAARKHSADMVVNNYFAHNALDGSGPQARIESAEYDWFTWGENIAGGNSDAAATMDQWMNSDGHCANLMDADFTEIGVGYMMGGEYGHTWTQVFGAPG